MKYSKLNFADTNQSMVRCNDEKKKKKANGSNSPTGVVMDVSSTIGLKSGYCFVTSSAPQRVLNSSKENKLHL